MTSTTTNKAAPVDSSDQVIIEDDDTMPSPSDLGYGVIAVKDLPAFAPPPAATVTTNHPRTWHGAMNLFSDKNKVKMNNKNNNNNRKVRSRSVLLSRRRTSLLRGGGKTARASSNSRSRRNSLTSPTRSGIWDSLSGNSGAFFLDPVLPPPDIYNDDDDDNPIDVNVNNSRDGHGRQSRSSFFDTASSSRNLVQICSPTPPPPPPPPTPPTPGFPFFHLGGEMMFCAPVTTPTSSPPPPATIALVDVSEVEKLNDGDGSPTEEDDKLTKKDQESEGAASSEINKKISTVVGRSRITVENICCALEIPAIHRILRPLDGVSNVLINVAIKTVYVDHELDIISAQEICDILTLESFPATVEVDAEQEQQSKDKTSTFVTSIFTLLGQRQQPQQELDSGANDDMAAVEVSKESLEQVRAFLATYDLDHIESFFLNDNDNGGGDDPTTRNRSPPRLTVVHNVLLLSATGLVDSIQEKTGLSWTVQSNGTDKKKWEFPTLQQGLDGNDNLGGVGGSGSDAKNASKNNAAARPRPAVILSGIFWIVSMLSFVGGNWDYLKYVALLSVALGIPPILIKAIRTLCRIQFDTNCLMLFAVIGALALQEFTEAAAVTFLYALSDWLEVRATTRAREALSSIVQLRPETANLIHPETKEIVVVPASAVPVGVCVSVRAGDKIPCDGMVVEGSSTVDESSLTGESRPVHKGPKDTVSGGTLNSGNTQMIVRVTAASDDSAVARLIRLVEEAQTNRSATEALVEEFAAVYTPLVLVAALSMCTIPWAWGRDVGLQWTHNGLVLLVIACPCALIISTPVSYVAGLAATAQKGILIKGGAYLEALGRVKTICFDKTGTLTQGKFQMLNLNVIGNRMSRKQILEFVYLMEERATHPMAQALVQGVKNENVQISKYLFVKDHTFLAGEGVAGSIDGKQVHVGNARLFKRLGLFDALTEEDVRLVNEWEAIGGTIGFMSVGDKGIVCAYCVMDAIRPEAKESLALLKKKGIDAYMLTGDQEKAAITIGNQVGLSSDCIKSELLPDEKLTLVQDLINERPSQRRRGGVMMVGDGVNDAPALAIASIGVAMGEGAALAMETADVTLIDSHLSKLVYSIAMGGRVISKIQQNVVFSLVVKFVVLGFAVSGKVKLWMAILVDIGSMLLVTWNSMSLIPRRREPETEAIVAAKPSATRQTNAADNVDKTSEIDNNSKGDNVSVISEYEC